MDTYLNLWFLDFCRVELRRRRRCVLNSQLVGDSLDESEQICRQRSRVASCRRCERTRRQSWPSLQFSALFSQSSIGGTKLYDFFQNVHACVTRRNITIAASRFFCFLFNLILPILPTANCKRQSNTDSNVYKHAACSVMRDVSCPTSIPLAAEL